MKKIALGDLGEFWYGDYKEPFEQLEGGVPGHPVGVVLKDDAGRVLCAYCGKTFESLGPHVRRAHGMSGKEYKQEVGLLMKSSLVSEKLRVRLVSRIMKRIENGTAPVLDSKPRGNPDNRGRKSGKWAPEALNLTGRCYSQVIAVAQSISRETGRITYPELKKRGIGKKLVRAYFTDLKTLQVISGAKVGRPSYTDDELKNMLVSLASEIGRTPSKSDIVRYGLPMNTLARRWGGYSKACAAAGLDPNLRAPAESFRGRVMVAYSITPTIRDVCRSLGVSQKTVEKALRFYGFPFSVSHGTEDTRRAWAAGVLAQERGAT